MKLNIETTKKEKHFLYTLLCFVFLTLNIVGGIMIGVEIFKDTNSFGYNATLVYTALSSFFYYYVMFQRNKA
jgi:hypothetical protein